jgi:MFS family permease
VLRYQWREVVLTALLRMGEQAPLVLYSVFFLVYTRTLGVPPGAAITISIIAGIIGAAATPAFGYLSDRIGRKVTFLIGAYALVLFAFPYFLLIGTADFMMMLIAAVVGQVIVAAMAGPEGALIAESFTGRLRYSGASIGAGLGAPLAGGVASILGVALFQHYRSVVPVALYMIFCAAVSILAVMLLRERSATDLNVEYDVRPASTATPEPSISRT